MGAERVGELLAGCEWVGLPFAGGMCEIPYIHARTIVANDLHADLMNLAERVQSDVDCADMRRNLRRKLFHPHVLRDAQEMLAINNYERTTLGRMHRAVDFFVVAWMTRSGTAGTKGELTGKLALRWEAGGGDSAKRYHSAIDALPKWCEEFKRCTFSCLDAFDFLTKCKDRDKHGIYCDPPFFGEGEKYLHNCGYDPETWHRDLADKLNNFSSARVVVRAYDCELIRELYPESLWTWHRWNGRKQTNDAAPEVLLVCN